MADKMIRISGRGEDGTAKGIKTDNQGRILTKSNGRITEVIKHYSRTSTIPSAYGFGDVIGDSSNPLDVSNYEKITIHFKNTGKRTVGEGASGTPSIQLLVRHNGVLIPIIEHGIAFPRVLPGEEVLIVGGDSNVSDNYISIPELKNVEFTHIRVTNIFYDASVALPASSEITIIGSV